MNADQHADFGLTEALEALRLTVEYVGIQTLRPLPGWSWYDVLSKYPGYADWLDSMVNPKPVDTAIVDEVQLIDGSGGAGTMSE